MAEDKEQREEAADLSELESTVESIMAESVKTIEDTTAVESQLSELEGTVADVRAQLDKAERKSAEYFDAWQRSQATFANFRKRTETEQTEWRATANAALLTRLLPIMDDFRRAFESMPEKYEEDPWLDGIRLIRRKLQTILDNQNVKPIEVEPGDTFDPKYHQAVLLQQVEGFDEDQIVAEVETGYMLGDRVLRPSMVVVAQAPPAPKAEESSGEEHAGTEETQEEETS